MPPRGYSLKEKKEIIEYIIRQNAFHLIKGRKLWIDYSNSPLTNRSWQSLKEVFKGILKDIRNPYYGLSEDIIKEFETRSKLTNNSMSWVCKNPITRNDSQDEIGSDGSATTFEDKGSEEYITSAVLNDNISSKLTTSTPNKDNGFSTCHSINKKNDVNNVLQTNQYVHRKVSTDTSSDESSKSSSESPPKSQPLYVLYKNKLCPVYFGNGNDYEQCYLDPIVIKDKLKKGSKYDEDDFCCLNIERLFHQHCLRYINEGKVGLKPLKCNYTKPSNIINIKHDKNCKYEKTCKSANSNSIQDSKKKKEKLPVYLDSENLKKTKSKERYMSKYFVEKNHNQELMKLIEKKRQNHNSDSSAPETRKRKSSVKILPNKNGKNIIENDFELDSQMPETLANETSPEKKTRNESKLGKDQMVEILNIEEICTPELDVTSAQKNILNTVVDMEKLNNDKQTLYSISEIEGMLLEENEPEKNNDRSVTNEESEASLITNQLMDGDKNCEINQEQNTETIQTPEKNLVIESATSENQAEQSAESKHKNNEVIHKKKKTHPKKFIMKIKCRDKYLLKRLRNTRRGNLSNKDVSKQLLNSSILTNRSLKKANSSFISKSNSTSAPNTEIGDEQSLSESSYSFSPPAELLALKKSLVRNVSTDSEKNEFTSDSIISSLGPSGDEMNSSPKSSKQESGISFNNTMIFDENYALSIFPNEESKLKQSSLENTLIFTEKFECLKDRNENALKHSVNNVDNDDIEPKDDWKLLSNSDIYNNLAINHLLNQKDQFDSNIFSEIFLDDNKEETPPIESLPKIPINEILPRTISDIMTEDED